MGRELRVPPHDIVILWLCHIQLSGVPSKAMSRLLAIRTMILMEKTRRMARFDLAGRVSSSSSGADDDDHNRDTEAGRDKKSPAPAHKE